MGLQPQHGFTLFETLVAVFVIALGVLGTAKMQQAMGQTVRHASYHATAAQIGAAIADSLRAGLHSAESGSASYMDALLAAGQEMQPNGKPTHGKAEEKTAGRDCYSADCSAAQLAQADLETWWQRMRAELPGGQLRICRDAHPWDEVKQAYRWNCESAGNAPDAPLVVKIGWRTRHDEARSASRGAADLLPAVVMTVAPYPL